MAEFPVYREKPWDAKLKAYIDALGALTIVNGGTVALDDALPEGTLLSYRVKAESTFSGQGGESVLAPGAYSIERTDTGWIYYLAGSGLTIGVPPDTTPPSAVTGLVATGGEEQIALSWSAATDAESPVSYRYRVWLTSGGATGTWTTTTGLTATITGLAPGAFTAEVYAYSAGGASATATATATVTAALSITDSFTAADSTAVVGRTPTGAGSAYVTHSMRGGGSVESAVIAGNRLTMPTTAAAGAAVAIPWPTPTGIITAAVDYDRTALGDPCLSIGDEANYYWARIDVEGAILYHVPSFDKIGVTAAGQPTTGRMELSIDGNNITLKVNGTTACSGTRTTTAFTAPKVALTVKEYNAGSKATLDNLAISG